MATEPGPVYEWDEDDEPRRSNVLWGRVVLLVVLLGLAFLLGRTTAPDRSADEVADLRIDLAEARERIQTLEEEAEAAPEATPTASPSPDATETPDGDVATETYTVRQGDTLTSIAEAEYGDPTLDDFLAEANGIDDPTSLRPGDEIEIPPEPTG